MPRKPASPGPRRGARGRGWRRARASSPSRSTTIGDRRRPGWARPAAPTSSNAVSGSPSMLTMSSPTSSPAAVGGRVRRRRCRRSTPSSSGGGAAEPLGERAVARARRAMRERDEEQHERLEEVHDRAGRRHEQPLRVRLLAVGAGLVLGRRRRLEVAHPDDADVGAERDALDAVLGLAALERPDLRPEAEEELGDLHARPLGGEVVAELVQEDHHDEGGDHDRASRRRRTRRGRRRRQQQRGELPVEAGDLALRARRGGGGSLSASRLVSVTG